MTPRQRVVKKQKVEMMVRKAERKRRRRAMWRVAKALLKFGAAFALVLAAFAMLYVLAGAYRSVMHQAQLGTLVGRVKAAQWIVPDGITFADDFQTAPAMERGKLDREQLDRIVESSARAYDVDPDLIRAIIHVESGGNPNAVNKGGDRGLMGLSPYARKTLGLSDKAAHDPATNVDAGTLWYSKIRDEHDGDEVKAIQNYNAGKKGVGQRAGLKYLRQIAAAPVSPRIVSAERSHRGDNLG